MGLGVIGTIILVVIFSCIIAASSWIIYVHLRARRLGLPTPTVASYNPFASRQEYYGGPRPAPGGIVGWVNDKVRSFRNRNNRTAGGAYEEPLGSNVRGARRGFGPLDPDEAWDTRVGNEADAYGPYEEQELGLTHPDDETSYDVERGRARGVPEPYIGGSKAGLDRRYDEEMGKPARNPFADTAEPSSISMRAVSPKPIDASSGKGKGKGHAKKDSDSERRSMFQEEM